jgi:hypothetical protein
LFTEDLKNGTGLAVALTGLIAAYWTGKVATQFSYYPMYEIPKKPIFKIGELLMNALFISFSLIFCWMFVSNLLKYFS